MTRLEFLSLSNNHLTGCIPADLLTGPSNDLDRLELSPCQGLPDPTSTAIPQPQTPCSNGIAVPSPADNPGLVNDCTILLGARDILAGTAILNWSAETPISEWSGVRVSVPGARVEYLHLRSLGLTGTIPPELGELHELDHLTLSYNRLTGEIPPSLATYPGWYNYTSKTTT